MVEFGGMNRISRRKFLKYATYAALGVPAFLTACTTTEKKEILGRKDVSPGHYACPPSDSAADIDCLVIGGGVSGVTAARYLVDDGKKLGKDLKVIVLEGSSRLGGRIETINSSHCPYVNNMVHDMGSLLIHRAKGTVSLWEDVERFNVPLITIPKLFHGYLYHSKIGRVLPLVRAAFAWNPYHAATIFCKVDSMCREKDISGAEFLERDGFTKRGSELGYDFVRMLLTGHLPAKIEEISLRGFGSDDVATQQKEVTEYLIPIGSNVLVERIAAGLDVRFNNMVNGIDWSAPEEGVIVTTKSGEKYKTKSVVCTFSVGMLKSGKIKFSPELPEIKQAALKSIGYGYMGKAAIQFRERFWPEDACMLHNPDRKRQAGRTYFVTSYGIPNAPPTLTALLHSVDAIKITSMPPERALEAICSDLSMMFPKYDVAKLVLHDKNSPHLGIAVKDWGKDEYALGGNSYLMIAENSVPVEKAREILADARTTPGVFWAGEATALALRGHCLPLSTQPASIHGAHSAGMRVAGEVLDYLHTGIIPDPISSEIKARNYKFEKRKR